MNINERVKRYEKIRKTHKNVYAINQWNIYSNANER